MLPVISLDWIRRVKIVEGSFNSRLFLGFINWTVPTSKIAKLAHTTPQIHHLLLLSIDFRTTAECLGTSSEMHLMNKFCNDDDDLDDEFCQSLIGFAASRGDDPSNEECIRPRLRREKAKKEARQRRAQFSFSYARICKLAAALTNSSPRAVRQHKHTLAGQTRLESFQFTTELMPKNSLCTAPSSPGSDAVSPISVSAMAESEPENPEEIAEPEHIS